MFATVTLNITEKQGSRACLMNTGETPFVAGQTQLVTVVILLSLKKTVC
jgi:hypothetical protein